MDERHPLFAEREEELRVEAYQRARSLRMRALLGSRTPGPFQEFEVWRLDDGTIHKVAVRMPRIVYQLTDAAGNVHGGS